MLRKVPCVRYFGYKSCIFCTPVDVVVSNIVNVARMLEKYHTSGIFGWYTNTYIFMSISTIRPVFWVRFSNCVVFLWSFLNLEALSSICLLESSSNLLFQQSKKDFITLRICLATPLHLWHASHPIFVVGCVGNGTILEV